MLESLPRNFIFILCGTIIVSVVAIVLYTQEQIRQQTEIIESERLITLNQVASRTELRIDNAIKILEILSKNEHITSSPSATFIDNKLHGIPENLDVNRRKEMRTVFDTYGGFQNMLFLLPNGDVYINEPFIFQKNLTVSNFAFRDWYKEVIAAHDAVVSDVIISKSSNKPSIVIALPVFSQNGSFHGILTGSLNLDLIQKRLEDLKSYTDERIIIMDHTRTVIVDSAGLLKGQKLPFEVEGIDNVSTGNSGIKDDTINGTKMLVAYYPIKAGQNTWLLISMQSYDKAFHSINTSIQESIILTTFIVVIVSGSVYVVNRLFQTQVALRKQVEDSNAFLTKTQAILLRSEEKYRNLYNISPDAIIVFDMTGIVTSYNESFKSLFGYSSEELLGKSIFDIVHDDSQDLAHSYFDDLRKTGILENKENWLKRKDGTIFPSLFSCSAMTDHNNSAIGYIAIIKNIEEIYNSRKKLQENKERIDSQYDIIQEQLKKLKEASKLKEEFSAMVTHELKTPLVPILGYCKMFKTSMLGKLNQEQSEAIEVIEKNSKRLEKLITDIMDARKLDLDRLKFKIDDLSLDEFFSDLDSDYGKILEGKACKITTNLDVKNLVIKTDRSRLKQVFDNLIDNAIKFVPEKDGKIKVGCTKENGDIVFYVKDNGIGIPPEKQKQLFQKFYQIDTSASRPVGGTGLGLAISRGIVEKLGGTISVESDGKTGTTFYIRFSLKS